MTETYNIYEAKTHFSQLLAHASEGKEILIAKAGKPQWKIVRIEEEKPKRVPGKLKGKIWYSDDCWDPMSEEELKDWYGEDLPPLESEKK